MTARNVSPVRCGSLYTRKRKEFALFYFLAVVTTNELAHGFLARPSLNLHPLVFLARGSSPTRSKQSAIRATLVSEPGSPSSFFPEDDDGDEHDDLELLELKITTSDTVINENLHANGKTQRSNPAMADTNFLRKRTTSLLELAQSDNHDAALSSRGMKVERKTFNFLFDAWAFSGEDDAAIQAMNLLKCMEEMGKSNPLMKPDVRSYTKVINAISRSASLNSGEDAERILANMETLYNSGHVAVKPNTFTYTAVMEAHANSGRPGSAERVEQLCELMVSKYEAGDPDVQPTARAFNAAIHAYGKAGDAEKAQKIFDRMEALHNSGAKDAKPKTVNFNTLISAWANCNDEGSAQRAGQVLDRMEFLFKRGSTDVVPTTVSYNAVIDAYAKSGEEDAPQKAESILNRMTYLYESKENVNARPNTRSFNSVINAWAKSGESEATAIAENLLDTMTRMSQDGNELVQPDVHSFCTVINAWARSQKPGKAERSYNLYRQMRALYEKGNPHVRPNVVAVNAVMNACAYTSGDILAEQTRAVEIAHKIMKDFEKSPYGKPDQVTYGTFLKVCANQMPDSHSREQIVEILFRKCCKDGQVGNLVIQQLKALSSKDLYQKLIGRSFDEDLTIEDLPEEWWCNVVEGKWRRKRNLS